MNQHKDGEIRKLKHLSAQEKFHIFLEVTAAKASEGDIVGEVMQSRTG